MEYEYVVMGKGVTRSVGLSHEGALKYANYCKQINPKCKPIIKEVSKEELRERFKQRFHNTEGYHKKIGTKFNHKHKWMNYMLGSQVCSVCGINRSETGYNY